MKQLPEIFKELFHDVMLSGIFKDSKAFADAIYNKDPESICAAYERKSPMTKAQLEEFVNLHFSMSESPTSNFATNPEHSIDEHIRSLWDVLLREADQKEASSRLPLPHSYIVPGGRFTEIYYWDSYFTMLGLRLHGRGDIIESMVLNFDHLIKTYGFIPNGTRSYYLNRSQPPFFSFMVSLLADIKGKQVYVDYLESLLKEYSFWMSPPRAVDLADGIVLNRYADNRSEPRPESYAEDVALSKEVSNPALLYGHLRSAAESGWDFSSRWMSNAEDLSTTKCGDFIPVDLNALLVQLELSIALGYRHMNDSNDENISIAEQFEAQARKRAELINEYCWDQSRGAYFDYNYCTKSKSDQLTAATCVPLFCKVASKEQAKQVAKSIEDALLAEGGLLTTKNVSGQQWDAPNAWAPLQLMAVKGFSNYDLNDIAKKIASGFTTNVLSYFNASGKLMEKYNAQDISVHAQGGEYPVQDGFGWTNGVYLALQDWLRIQLNKKGSA